MEAHLVLPNPTSAFSRNLLTSLDEHFKTQHDLLNASHLSAQIKKDYADLDRKITILRKTLSSLITQCLSRSNNAKHILHRLTLKLQHFNPEASPDVFGKVGLKKIRKNPSEELGVLVEELRRTKTIRGYLETTLRLESLVGDLEDAVLCVMNQKGSNLIDSRGKHEKMSLCVGVMGDIEDVLMSISRNHPEWCSLLKSVDARVEKQFGVLRLQAIAEHRGLLSSIGWPPSLLTSNSVGGGGSELANPLVLMQGQTKERYSQSFLALCSLQCLHVRRTERKHTDVLVNTSDHRRGLWAIDELVSPLALKTEHHFAKWLDEPKLIFTCVYRVTKDFVFGVDAILQPLIDKAMLAGCSAREEWVCSMSEMLSTYLKKRMFSDLADRYMKKDDKAHTSYSWLHLVDLIIAFDKRMHALADLGTAHFLGESIWFSKEISLLSIFCDQPGWLRIWAKIELKDALKKLNSELENPKAWMSCNKAESDTEFKPEPFILSSMEDHKAPVVAEVVVKIAQRMMERCQTLPSILIRAQFIRSSSVRFLWHFFSIILQRCAETACMDNYADDTIIKICGSVNAARYCESMLREWSEDLKFIEMRLAEDERNVQLIADQDDRCCFFWEEVKFLMKLETDWIVEIMEDLLRKFDSFSQEYVQNKVQWSWKQESCDADVSLVNRSSVSIAFVEPLNALRSHFRVLKTNLNSKDFLYLWRSIADGIDQFVFSCIVTSGATFSNWGVVQFSTDMQALFLVFKPFCVRPEAFFPCIRDSLKLFELKWGDAENLQSILAKDGKKMEILQLHGISYISPEQAKKILRCRKFEG